VKFQGPSQPQLHRAAEVEAPREHESFVVFGLLARLAELRKMSKGDNAERIGSLLASDLASQSRGSPRLAIDRRLSQLHRAKLHPEAWPRHKRAKRPG
jgi:hypothetical protein